MQKTILAALITGTLIAGAVTSDSEAIASQAIHPDCVDNARPELCTRIIDRYQVISPDLVFQYGYYTGAYTLKDGSVVSADRRTLLVWTRNHGDPARPFVIAGEFDEVL
jgi:hypothetical protein